MNISKSVCLVVSASYLLFSAIVLLHLSFEATGFSLDDLFPRSIGKSRNSHRNQLQQHKVESRAGIRKSSSCLSAGKKGVCFKNFDEFLMQQQNNDYEKSLIAVTFSSPFCGPCKRMKEELVTVKKSMGEIVTLVAIDSNKYPTLSCRYNITELPCTIIFKYGKEVHRIHGIQRADQVIEDISSFML